MKLSLGISPCPNDTFMFDALLHNRIDTQGIEFNYYLEDVETLNRKAQENHYDISKISYHGFLHVLHNYQLLDSGSALGRGCGPLLISKRELKEKELQHSRVGIPGKYTTANLLCSLMYPNIKIKEEMVFSEIEEALLAEIIDAGVIIHENRFTYLQKGLRKVQDLGDFWETETGFPIPLGGIVIKRSLPQNVKSLVEKLVAESVQFAFEHPEASNDFVSCHAQEMDNAVMKQHIQLYVNEFSLSLGVEGKAAIQKLIEKSVQKNLIEVPDPSYTYFV